MSSKNKTDVKPIYVIAGKDEFLAAGQVTGLVNQLLKPEEMQMCLWRTEGDKVSPAEIFDELRTLPFLAERRVVVLTDADDFVSENREHLEKYFESPSASGILILVVKTWQSNTRLAKRLPSVGQLIEIGELTSRNLVTYVIDYAKQQHGKNISYNAAQMLIELAGDEPGVLCCEIDKLAAFTNTAKAIMEKDIAAIVGRNRIFGAFEVIDSMTAGNTGKALEKLRSMFNGDKDAEYTTVGAFAWHFRRMFSANAMIAEGQSPEKVARKFRIWNSNEFFRTLKKMPLERIGGCLKQLAEIDYDIKTGRATAETAIETMVVQLANQ